MVQKFLEKEYGKRYNSFIIGLLHEVGHIETFEEDLDEERDFVYSLLKIDCNNLLHVSRKPYIIVGTEEINGIIYQDKMDFETLLQVYINIVSYINQKDVSDADLGKIDLSYEIYGKMDIHLSCFASINTLCTKRFSGDKNEEVWISRPTMLKALKLLEEIGAISIVVPKKPKGCKQNFSNHCCYPRHKEMVQRIADNYVKQVLS